MTIIEKAQKFGPQALPFSKPHRVLVTIFLVWYYTIVAIWISPDGPFKNFAFPNLRWMAALTGVGQGWSLFSPGIRTYNSHMSATITFADGSTKLYEFPRLEKMNLFEKLRREKLRKIFVDLVPMKENYHDFYPAISRFLARANNDPENPPIMVTLTQNWVKMLVPVGDYVPPYNEFPEHSNHDSLFVYKVTAQDLK